MAKKSNDIEKMCMFCRFSSLIKPTEDMLCSYKGVVDKEFSCRKFVYDPLKRVPRRLPEFSVPEELANREE